jgi:hypothetical protein
VTYASTRYPQPDNPLEWLGEAVRRSARVASLAPLGPTGDTTTPPVVTGLTASASLTRDVYGQDTATIAASWDAIQYQTPDTDTTTAPDIALVKGYLVSYSVAGGWSREAFVETNSVRIPGVTLSGTSLVFRVRTQSENGALSAYSTTNVTIGADTTPPPVPSQPTVTAMTKGVKIRWDGTFVGNAAQPDDFSHVLVDYHYGDNVWLRAGTLQTAGDLTLATTGLSSVTARLTAYDKARNASAASVTGTNTAAAVFNADVAAAAIDTRTLADLAVATGKLADSAVVATKIGDGAVTAPKVGFVVGGGNQVPNSSFEAWDSGVTIPDNWSKGAAVTVARVADKPTVHGTYSVEFSATAGGNTGTNRLTSSDVGIRASQKYSVSFYARRMSGTGELAAGVDSTGFPIPRTGGGSSAQTAFGAAANPTAWTRITVPFTAGGSTAASMFFAPMVANDVWRIDNVQIEAGDVVTAYAPKPDELLPGSVAAAAILDGSIGSAEIADLAVISTKVGPGAITPVKTAIASIDSTSGNLTSNSVGTTQLVDSAIVANKLASGAVTAPKVGFVVGGGNLLSNSGFESSTAPNAWVNASNTSAVGYTTAQKRTGSQSLTFTVTATGGGTTLVSPPGGGRIAVQPNTTYTYTAYVRAGTTSRPMRLRALLFQSNNSTNATNGTLDSADQATTTTGWTRLTHTFTTSADAAWLAPQAGVASANAVAGEVFYVDDVQVEVGDVATAYAPKPDEILPGTVGTTEIAPLAITAPKISVPAIDSSSGNLTANSVTTNTIAANAVTANAIAANSVTAGKIAADAVTANEIAANSITTSELAANSVTANAIAANTITAAKIAAGTITSAEIAADTITAGNIAANAITSSEIAANAVTAGKVAADAITANEIAANAISTSELAANSVVSDKVAANAITANKLLITTGGGNQCPNSSFEDGLTGWSNPGGDASITRTTPNGTPAIHGTKVARATLTNLANYQSDNSHHGGITRDLTWRSEGPVTVTGWARTSNPAHSPAIRVVRNNTYSGANDIIDTTVIQTAAGGAWRRVKATLAASPAGQTTTTLHIRLFASGWTANGDWIEWDGIQIEEGDVPTTYSPQPDEILPGTIVSNMVAANAITAGKIAADAVTANEIAANSITTSELAANAVVAGKIAAGSVTTEKLTVASLSDNVLLNGSFEEVASADATLPAGWLRNVGWTTAHTGTVGLTTSSPISGSRSVTLQTTSTANGGSATLGLDNAFAVPTKQGDIWHASVTVRSSVAIGGGVYLRLGYGGYNTGELIASSGNLEAQGVGTSAVTLEGQFVIPAGVTAVRPFLLLWGPGTNNTSAVLTVDDITLQKVTTSARIADGAIVTDKLAANAVTASKITAGSVDASKIAADTITAGQIAANAISTSELAANSVVSDKVAANAITASKITVANLGDNLLLNGRFDDWPSTAGKPFYTGGVGSRYGNLLPEGWTNTDAAGAYDTGRLDANSTVGPYSGYIYCANNGSHAQFQSPVFPVKPGASYLFGVKVANDVAGSSNFVWRVVWLNQAGGQISFEELLGTFKTTLPTTYTLYEQTRTAPAGAARAYVNVYNFQPSAGATHLLVDDLYCRERATASLIVDGSIVTDKLAANAVTAEKVVAGAITTSKLTVAAISPNMVPNGNFEEGTNGWAFCEGTGGNFYTEASSDTWQTSGSTTAVILAQNEFAINSEPFPVNPGERLFASLKAANTTNGAATYWRLFWYTSHPGSNRAHGGNFTDLFPFQPFGVTSQPTQRFDGAATVPANVKWARLAVYNWQPGSYLVLDDVFVGRSVVGTQITDSAISTNKIAANAIVSNHITAGAVIADKVAADAITGKTITGGVFRTGIGGQGDRIEIVDTIRDAVRWVRDSDGSISAELRGYMNTVAAYGLYINSNVQIGNQQSTIHQVGKRKMNNGANASVRVRGGSFSGTTTSGAFTVSFSNAFDTAPDFVHVTLTNTHANGPFWYWVTSLTTSGFTLNVRVLSGGAYATPGNGQVVSGYYYAEVGV